MQVLQGMHKSPDFAVFRDCLPILGVDGTLVDSVPMDSPARGKVFAKTGTYTDADLLHDRGYLRSKSLAGMMTAANGKTLYFALFVNDVPLVKGITTVREGKQLGKLCEIIYELAP